MRRTTTITVLTVAVLLSSGCGGPDRATVATRPDQRPSPVAATRTPSPALPTDTPAAAPATRKPTPRPTPTVRVARPTATSTQDTAPVDEGYALNNNRDGTIVRWNPCRKITYAVNLAQAPPGALADVQQAVANVSQATGLTFTYLGPTNEMPSANSDIVTANVVIAWAQPGQSDLLASDDEAAHGGWRTTALPSKSDWVWQITSGFIVVDASENADWAPGFGTGMTRGAMLMHELGHVVGLNHVTTRDELMYKQIGPGTRAAYGVGDLAGLHRVGRAAGCIN